MPTQSNLQRWISIALLGMLLGLLATHGAPAIAYRISQAIHRGQAAAQLEGLDQRIASLHDTSTAFRTISERVKPAVVYVTARALELDIRGASPRMLMREEHGSGVIVDPRGFILTNYHVIEGCEEVEIKLPDYSEPLRARIRGEDPSSDLALLQITPLDRYPLTPVLLGDSDNVAVGDWVLAIGSPAIGLDQSVTAGIVSAKGRRGVLENIREQDFIQTDAAINVGNSGGPLVNMKGEVIGINTAKLTGEYLNIGFAIPSKLAKVLVEHVIHYDCLRSGWIGGKFQPWDGDHSQEPASAGAKVEVVYVVPQSPAMKAGVKCGDLILEWDGSPLGSVAELHSLVRTSRPGTRVPIKIQRGATRLDKEVTIEISPARPALWPGEAEWGLQIQKLTPEFSSALAYDSTDGLLIHGIRENKSADQLLIPGDVIEQVNGVATVTMKDYCRQFEALPADAATVELTVRGQKGIRQVRMPSPARP